ncbi:hypothetical protein [Shouchella lonarensis]|uniref:hypothetical protein n=1 Tax=Shouchella lonarensis TaxID=1464122 RepID=UPI00114D3EEB|nr:hypothetical protein [Shouchella lonarensis]
MQAVVYRYRTSFQKLFEGPVHNLEAFSLTVNERAFTLEDIAGKHERVKLEEVQLSASKHVFPIIDS